MRRKEVPYYLTPQLIYFEGDIEIGLIVKHSVKVWLKPIAYTIGSNSIPQLFCFEGNVEVGPAAKHSVKEWLEPYS